MVQPQFEVGMDGPKLTIPLREASRGDIDDTIKRVRAELDLEAAELRLSRANDLTAQGLIAEQQALIRAAYQAEIDMLIEELDCRSKAIFDELAAISKEIENGQAA